MAMDPQSRRRRAAAAVLRSLLDDDTLRDALQMVAEWRGDSVDQIITYVDRVARHARFDAPTCKRLYSELYAVVRRTEDALPDDPFGNLPMTRPASSIAAAAPAIVMPPAPPQAMAAAPPAPSHTSDAEPSVTAPAAAAATPFGLPDAAPECVVFAEVVRTIIAALARRGDNALAAVGEAALDELDRVRLPEDMRSICRAAFVSIDQHDWVIKAGGDTLAAIVHVLYIALCEAIGPVDADRYLTLGIERAATLPEARAFPPRRLL